MICRTNKIIHVHIPRTAGTSIEIAVFKPEGKRDKNDLWMQVNKNGRQLDGMQHFTCNNIIAEIGIELFNKCFKFSVIRNPYDKIISDYKFIMENNRGDIYNHLKIRRFCSFLTFLKAVKEKEHPHQLEQWKFLYNDKMELLVNVILRFENINIEYQEMVNKYNLKVNTTILKTINTTKKTDSVKEYLDYNVGSIELINEIYKKDFELFNYTINN